MGRLRSTKWYRKNEEEVMRKLGLVPTKNSGAGWIEKEDGQNDYLICQLKSTDAGSIGVKKKDLEILEYNADVSHKIPVFALQFIGDASDDIWLMMKPTDIEEVAKYIDTGVCKVMHTPFEYEGYTFDSDGDGINVKKAKVRSARGSRERLEQERMEEQERFKKRRRSWCRK